MRKVNISQWQEGKGKKKILTISWKVEDIMCRAQEASGFIKCKLKVFSQNKDCIFQSVGLGFLTLVLFVDYAESVACLGERPVCQSLSVVCPLQMSVYP